MFTVLRVMPIFNRTMQIWQKLRYVLAHSYLVSCRAVIFFFMNEFNALKILNHLKVTHVNVLCRIHARVPKTMVRLRPSLCQCHTGVLTCRDVSAILMCSARPSPLVWYLYTTHLKYKSATKWEVGIGYARMVVLVECTLYPLWIGASIQLGIGDGARIRSIIYPLPSR